MKDFFKYTLATVLGLIVAGIIFTVIGLSLIHISEPTRPY